MPKIFNDPIHGHIALPQLCVQIIDTPIFQRLRHIKQLGATYKVYPGASHNRFEHSLGVCHLAGKFVEHLRTVQSELFTCKNSDLEKEGFEISNEDVLCIQVAGLCHDLGHGPLSHVFETYFINKLRSDKDQWSHEKATRDLLDHLWKFSNNVFKCGLVKLEKEDLEFIKELIHKSDNAEEREKRTGRSNKKDFLYEIISNDENSIDVDKWDYFARDCFHLGFKNNFDHNRLIQFSRLIEVDVKLENGSIEKKWHICYREKEVENLYHMFYSRVILHKRACLHKTTKIIEIMYMEALEKVNEYLKIKGTDDEELEKISDCIHDPVAYGKLTDNIFDLIRYMVKPCKENKETLTHNDNKEIQAIQQAIQILDYIENRKLYKFIGEAISEGGKKFHKKKFREEERKIEYEISQLEIDNKKLDREDFLINILEFSYGGTDNPVNKVYFYVKSDPKTAIPIEREEVSFLLPTVYCEQVVRMYSRKLDGDKVHMKQCRDYFEKWCINKEMKGKWQLYAKANSSIKMSSGLEVFVKAGATASESSVTATGQVIHIITDTERSSFGIGSDSDLKGAVEKYFGKWPNDAFLHSPTPWEDLYESYGWAEVQMVLEPKKAQILEVSTKPTILATKILKNESNKTATFTTNITEEVKNTVSNTWERSSKVSIDQTIKYNIGFLGTGAGGETKFGFKQTWGKSEAVSKQTSVGTEARVAVELQPGKSATVELCASSGTMRVRVTYEARLTGSNAVNYTNPYKGHHYWGLPIDAVIGSKKVQITQDIEIGYFSDAIARLRSTETKEEMIFHMAEH